MLHLSVEDGVQFAQRWTEFGVFTPLGSIWNFLVVQDHAGLRIVNLECVQADMDLTNSSMD